MAAVVLHPPNSSHSDVSPENVPYDRLLGRWHVIASTLPLWKDKRDVTITYMAIIGEAETTFDDLVEYASQTAKPGSKRSKVEGVDTLQTDVEGNGARWKWRGKGLLKPITSHWQLLGHSLPSPATPSAFSSVEPEWAVTYFSSTLFTSAGLDFYARDPTTVSDEKVAEIVRKLEELGGEVEKLVKDGGMFRVPCSAQE
ncbi:hypothetical protein JCM8547_001306 [Rhodosporidiobolus lusitaniae]